MLPPADFSLFYVDDSGSQDTGYTTYSWVQIQPMHWGAAEQHWLQFRRALYDRHGIATSTRLHATELANARTHPSGDPSWKRRTGFDVVRESLDAIAALPGITIGTVYRYTDARRTAFAKVKYELYTDLVAKLNHDLSRRGDYGMVIMDGADDPAYTSGHRALGHNNRRIIETPCFRHADTNQWVQIADLIAWTAYRSVRPTSRRDPASTWYRTTLGHLDTHGGPIAL